MGNIADLGMNWYVDTNWTGTITPAISTAQNNFNQAYNTLQTAATAYKNAKTALDAAIAANDTNAIQTARSTFNSAQNSYNSALLSTETAQNALISAENAARTDIDSGLDTNMSHFASQLHTPLNTQINLLGNAGTGTLGDQFVAADATRINARNTFQNNLTNFYSSQSALNQANATLQQDNDSLLLAQAQLAIDQVNNPSNVPNDQTAIFTLQSQITQDTATVTSLQNQTNGLLALVQSSSSTYQAAISAEIALLQQANASSLAQQLIDIQNNAFTQEQNVLTTKQAADQAALAQLVHDFPTLTGNAVNVISAFNDALDSLNTQALANVQVNPEIHIPALPATGQMSMSQLMQFITLAEVLLDELVREIRRADAEVNAARLAIYANSGFAAGSEAAQLAAYGLKLLNAELAYNAQVSADNKTTYDNVVSQVAAVSNNSSVISGAATQLTQKLFQQKSIADAATQALNSSLQMGTDDAKIQLWTDYEQLQSYQAKLQTLISSLPNSDPTRASLQTVNTSILTVLADIQGVATLLTKPLDQQAVQQAQNTLANDQTALTNAINALPSGIDPQAQSAINGFSSYIATVTNDLNGIQSTLATAYTSASGSIISQLNSFKTFVTAARDGFLTIQASNNSPYITSTLNDLNAVLTQVDSYLLDLANSAVDVTTLSNDQNQLQSAFNQVQIIGYTFQGSNFPNAQVIGDSVANAITVLYYENQDVSTTYFPSLNPASQIANAIIPPLLIDTGPNLGAFTYQNTNAISNYNFTFNNSFTSRTQVNNFTAAAQNIGQVLFSLQTTLNSFPINTFTLQNALQQLNSSTQILIANSTDIINGMSPTPPFDIAADINNILDAIPAIQSLYTQLSNQPVTIAPPALPPTLPTQEQVPVTSLGAPPIYNFNPLALNNLTPPQPEQGSYFFNVTPQPDVSSFNSQVLALDKQIAPLIALLQQNNPNLSFSLIDPIFYRDYIGVNPIAGSSIDFGQLISMIILLTSLLLQANTQKTNQAQTPTEALFSAAQLIGKANLAGSEMGAQSVGAGTGIGGANLFSAAGNIAQSLTNVVSNTGFFTYVQGLLENAGVVGGIAALGSLTQTAQATTTRSQFGVVTNLETPPEEPAAATGLTQPQTAALTAGVKELVGTATNVPQLKDDILKLLKAIGSNEAATVEEIKALISLLLFLEQLVALLVAAAATQGAQGVTNIDNIVQQAFEPPVPTELAKTVANLANLGVAGIPQGITPANPTFLPTFFNAVQAALAPAEQNGFVAQVAAVFTNRGLTLPNVTPIGTAIQQALTQAEIGVAATVRQDLNALAQKEGDNLRSQILHDESRRPTITNRINAINPTGLSNIPKAKSEPIVNALNLGAPTIPSVKPEERNNLVLAVANKVITPEQARGILNQHLQEEALKTNPVVANLLPEKPGTPATQPGTAGELPDTLRTVVEGFKSVAKQSSNQNFAQEVVTRFADSIRNQSDFFQKSLTLILNPANTYVKNFSIATRQTTGHDTLGSISQIPISG